MPRMGHASPRAALIYQHATAERDVAIAEAISRIVELSVGEGDQRAAETGPAVAERRRAEP